MGIEDIQISEELETNAPSIKYSGNEGPKSPQQMQQMMMAQLEEEYLKYVEDMLEQGMEPMSLQQFMEQAIAEGNMAGGNPLPQDPTKPVNPFAPKPTGPTLPDRQMAAYGGIMGVDGRKQYGIGSFFQKYIKDPIEMAITGKTYEELEEESQERVDNEAEGYENPLDTLFKGKQDEKTGKRDDTGLNQYIIPAIGGAVAGLFTKKNEDGTTSAASPDETALQLANLKKSANVLGQKEGLAANLNFLPAESARKYSPTEMIEVYQNAANGGRIGFEFGGMGYNSGVPLSDNEGFGGIERAKRIYDNLDPRVLEMYPDFMDFFESGVWHGQKFAQGGRINRAEGGIMDLGGMEKDYRAEGGFVPIGREEKADDVPARLSVNEFVFTADAVRSAGGGDIDQGAKVMENMMKHLEAGGQVSEESQGLGGAREMFETSERLSEVI